MKKVLIVLAGLVVLVIAALGIAILTFDINTYRPQITDVLGKQMGRAVTLGGPLKLDLSWHGVALSVQDAAIANPSWASRPVMAGIGRFQLGLALMPLFSHQISVTDLQIENADILLESASGDRHNWVIQPAAQTGAPATVAGAGA